MISLPRLTFALAVLAFSANCVGTAAAPNTTDTGAKPAAGAERATVRAATASAGPAVRAATTRAATASINPANSAKPAMVKAATAPAKVAVGAEPATVKTVTAKDIAKHASAKPTAPKVARHGAIDGSFTDGKLILGKTIPVNGFHPGEPVLVLVDKGSHTTYILQKQANDRVVKVFSTSDSIGANATPTPPGPYWVVRKVKWPCWTPTKKIDPEQKPVQPYNKDHKNPLGVARIELNKWEMNLHGTNRPGSIRESVSHGCIRHSNEDIMKIFDMVSVGTPVIVANQFVGETFTKDSFDLHGHSSHRRSHSKKR